MAAGKRIALYSRVPLAQRAQYKTQLRTMDQRCRESGAEIAGAYADIVDEAVPLRDCTGFANLLKGARNGQFDQVLVWSLEAIVVDNLEDAVQVWQMLHEAGVSLRSCSDSFENDSPEGYLELEWLVVDILLNRSKKRGRASNPEP